MKKFTKILVVLLLSIFFVMPSVSAYTKDSKEYKACLKNCKEKTGGNGSAYTACTSSCNAKLDDAGKTKKSVKASSVKFCAKTASIWQIVGYVFLILKVVIPLILLVTGIIDLSQAVLNGKDDSLSKIFKKLMMRIIAALLIFFVPTIVGMVMGLVSNFAESGAQDDYNVCITCITSPSKCDTSSDVGKK